MRVLLIEDDLKVVEVLRLYLQAEGFEVDAAASGEDGLRSFERREPDIVVLDIRLPGIDGWAVAKGIRKQRATPLILLTSRTSEADRVLGFELGADDYVPKPFSPRELVARIKAVLRRARGGELPAEQQVLRYRGLTIDPITRTVKRADRPVDLTRREFDLLWKMASSPGRVFAREALYESAWGDQAVGDLHTLDVHINRLRTKIEAGGGPRYLITVRGVGYRFEVAEDA
jgi:two-component system response regulator ResD